MMMRRKVFFADNNYLYTYNYKRNTPDKTGLFVLADITTSIEEQSLYSKPGTFKLFANYPNPFNPTTKITFSIGQTQHVKIDIFDVNGRWIKSLIDEAKGIGTHIIIFDAQDYASGTYIYRLSTTTNQISKRMLLIR